MTTWKKTIWFRLAVGAVAVILVANALLSVVTVATMARVPLAEVQTRVRLDLNSAREVIRHRGERIQAFLQGASIRRHTPHPLTRENLGDLDTVLQLAQREAGIDLLCLLDPRGRVIYRPNNPALYGDNLAQDPLVARVLRERRPASGTALVSHATLEREGSTLANRARLRVRDTRAARRGGPRTVEDGMVLAAAVPLVDVGHPGEILAVLYGADLLNRRFDLVDAIRDEVFQGQTYQGRDLGTVTIFQGDVRITTNVRTVNGSRAVATRMSATVYDRVVVQGQRWADRAWVVDDWYITAYEPIESPDGHIIGALYVGLLEEPFTRTQRLSIGVFIVAVGATTLASLALLLVVIRSVLRPLGRVVAMAEKVAGGDLRARVGVRPPGELGALCRAVDQMGEAVCRREEQLRAVAKQRIGEAERLASVGRLAAGVAHEVNNPLTGVLTFAMLLRSRPDLDADATESLDVVIRETTRVREIVRGLLDFARESPVNRRPLDLNDVVRQMLGFVRRQKEFGTVSVAETLHAGHLTVSGDRFRLQQVFLNLFLNAAQAMPQGGTLRVSSRIEDGQAVVEVGDTGCGIPAEDRVRIFEPFFTTKPIGMGTGLGLSVSYGIIQQHHGTIDIDSEEGKGSTFTVRLPYVRRADEEAAP